MYTKKSAQGYLQYVSTEKGATIWPFLPDDATNPVETGFHYFFLICLMYEYYVNVHEPLYDDKFYIRTLLTIAGSV